jgi:hypothetical protein
MPSWHVREELTFTRYEIAHSSVDEDSLCFGCNDARGLGVFKFSFTLSF